MAVIVPGKPKPPILVETTTNAPVAVALGRPGPKGDQGDIGPAGPAGTSLPITISNTAPLSPSIGDVWIDTN